MGRDNETTMMETLSVKGHAMAEREVLGRL